MKKLIILIGVIAGAASWGVVALISDKYEPFDSTAGFLVGQFMLSAIAWRIGYKQKFSDLAVYLLGAYVGMNTYSYIFGGGEQRAWVLLGLITTVGLLVIPFVCGLLAKLVTCIQQKRNHSSDEREV